jgi:hypothetical protein
MIRRLRCPERIIALLAGAMLASATLQAAPAPLDTQGSYTCLLEGDPDSPKSLPGRRTALNATGRLELEVTGNEVEIFDLRFTLDPDPRAITLDPAVPASSRLRPLISSFEVPVGLLVENTTGAPEPVAAQLVGTIVARGISASLNGRLPGRPASSTGTLFNLALTCRQAPIAVEISKRRVCPGEDVVVEARREGARQIWIDGVPGARRVLEFAGEPGLRRILITARTAAGIYEYRVRTVVLRDCPPTAQQPLLIVTPSVFRPHELEFLVEDAGAPQTTGADHHWSFGDGTTASTRVPFVTHSYAERMPVDQESVTFEAEVTIARQDGTHQTTQKTVSLWNHYAFNRLRGTLQVPAEVAQPRLTANAGQWTGEALLRNLENAPVALGSLEAELQPCDAEADPQPLPPLAIAVELQPHGTATLPVSVPRDATTAGVCGVAVHVFGHGPDGLAAQADAYFDLPREVGGSPVGPRVSAFLGELATAGLVADADYVSFDELRRLRLEGRLLPTSPTLGRSGAAVEHAAAAGVPGEDDEPVPGAECNPSASGRPGLTCQATGDFAEDPTPPRIANALKGDLLLHAECNFIGLVLRGLTVPQLYTHEAIMTRNYFELRHHTALFDWFTDHIAGTTIQTDALYYGWPGTMTMSVTDAFLGRAYTDPEGNVHTLRAINLEPTRCFRDPVVSPPLVVKPDREGYTPEVRERLKRAADQAEEIQGHYRFYGFTDGSIGLPEKSDFKAPERIAWAAGSPAAVSSTFIWTALHLAGVKLEGDLADGPEDVEDLRNGAWQDEHTLDGQYLYSEAERRSGLEVLYEDIERLQQENAGTVLGFFGQTSDQLANCFAADRCAEDDTDKGWKHPGVGRTTSPSNFLFWDKPKYGGSYGLSEPLVFRDGGYRRIHRWTPGEGTGTVEVTVVWDADGSPAPDTTVVLMGLDHRTDGFGKTVFAAIPQGAYELQASRIAGSPPQHFSADCRLGGCLVTVTAGATSSITLRLRREPVHNRLVSFIGLIKAKDAEAFPEDDVRGEWPVNESCAVRPEQREDRWEFSRCLGDEVVVKLKVTCRLLADNETVNVAGLAELHESTGCGDEREDHEEFLRDLGPGAASRIDIDLANELFLQDDDTASFLLTIINGEGI